MCNYFVFVIFVVFINHIFRENIYVLEVLQTFVKSIFEIQKKEKNLLTRIKII